MTINRAYISQIGHFFNQHDSFLGHHVKFASRKSLEIQAYLYHKTRNPFEKKCIDFSF